MKWMKRYLSLLLNGVVIITASIGFMSFLALYDFNFAKLILFSVICDILTVICSSVVLFFEIRKLKGIPLPRAVVIARHMNVVFIAITVFVFFVFLFPKHIEHGDIGFLLSEANLFSHVIMPAFAFLDWFFCADARCMKKTDALYSLIPFAAYATVIYTHIGLGGTFGGEGFPYEFMDVKLNGLFSFGDDTIGVVYSFALIAIAVIVVSFGIRDISVRMRNGEAGGGLKPQSLGR